MVTLQDSIAIAIEAGCVREGLRYDLLHAFNSLAPTWNGKRCVLQGSRLAFPVIAMLDSCATFDLSWNCVARRYLSGNVHFLD